MFFPVLALVSMKNASCLSFSRSHFAPVIRSIFFFYGILSHCFYLSIDFNTAPSRQWEPSSSNSFRSCTWPLPCPCFSQSAGLHPLVAAIKFYPLGTSPPWRSSPVSEKDLPTWTMTQNLVNWCNPRKAGNHQRFHLVRKH